VDKPEPVEGQQETGLCLKMRQQRHIPNGPTPGGMLGLGGDEFAIFNKVSISLPALPRVQEGMRPCSLPYPNPKYFLFHPSNQIFRRMHGALNIGKKDN
jgi:hypothetical protein